MLAYSYLRFSSAEQKKGDSIRRQSETRDRYIERKKLTLDTTLTLADEGVSAFRGKNAEKGALSLFLAACKDGRIKRGSVLIVENLDRLSRADPDKAVRLFLDILDFGITLVTLEPEKEFRKPVDMTGFLIAIIELCRGNSESRIKSYRLKEIWSERRKALVDGEKLTHKVPSWINAKAWEADTAKKKIIERIFRLCRDGDGFQAIAKLLNKEGIKPISKSRFWHQSYIEKLINNRRLLGEFQPQMLNEEGERVNVGSVIKDYFPIVIDADLWDGVHQALAERRTHRSRIVKSVSNLFTDIAYIDGETLCHRKRAGIGYLTTARQDAVPLKYKFFERAILLWLKEANIRLGENMNYENLEKRRDDLSKRIKTLETRIATEPELETLLDTLVSWKKDLAAVSEQLEAQSTPQQTHIIHGKELIAKMETCEAGEREAIRRSLKQTIRMVIKRIDVRVKGERWGEKLVHCLITFRNAGESKRAVTYRTKGGTLREVNLALNAPGLGIDNKKALDLILENVWTENLFTHDDSEQKERRQQIETMRADGLTEGEIAKRLGVHRCTLYKWMRHHKPQEQAEYKKIG